MFYILVLPPCALEFAVVFKPQETGQVVRCLLKINEVQVVIYQNSICGVNEWELNLSLVNFYVWPSVILSTCDAYMSGPFFVCAKLIIWSRYSTRV